MIMMMKVEYCGGCNGDDQECYDRMNAAAGGCTPAYIRRLGPTQQQPNVICGEMKAAAAAAAQPPFMTTSSSSLCCFEMMHLKTAGMVVAYVELMLLISLLSSLAAQCVVRGYSPALLLTVIVSGIQALCLYSLVIGIKRERLDFLLLSMASIGIRLLLAGVYLIAVVIANYVQPIKNGGIINGDSEYADDDHDGSSSLLISDLHSKNIVILCSTVAVVFVVVYGYCEWLIWRLYSYLGAIDECILVGSASSCIMEQPKSATTNGLVGKKRSMSAAAAAAGGHVTSCRWLCWHWFSGRSSWRRECCDHDGHLANARDSCSSTFSLWAIDKNNGYRNCNNNNNNIQYKTTTITLDDEEQKRVEVPQAYLKAAVEQREFIRRAVMNKEAVGDGQMAAMTTSTMITTASSAPAPESVQSSPERKLERSLTIKMASA